MNTLIIIAFIAGYALITLESRIKINKAAIALFTGVVVWTIYILFRTETADVNVQLEEHLGNISEIIFFLIGAMTIVELIDSYHGFDVITSLIKTHNKRILLVIISFITFFLSSLLDNLTTTIVMVTLVRKLIHKKNNRLVYISMIVIAANAGGAWTPIGDITTTMLWIGGQITTWSIIKEVFLPSLVSMLIPLAIISRMIKGDFKKSAVDTSKIKILSFDRKVIFIVGISALIFVPIFKTLTNLPPYMGMLVGLAVLWIVSEIIAKNKLPEHKITVTDALHKIDISSVMFFLGILIAVASLEATGLLADFSTMLSQSVGNLKVIAMSIGVFSAVIDNVPLVAAAMGMYDMTAMPPDHYFWTFIAYCAGTGGSILIIGSAAGVAAMGLEQIDFFWYLKKISWIALLGYFAGAFLYILGLQI